LNGDYDDAAETLKDLAGLDHGKGPEPGSPADLFAIVGKVFDILEPLEWDDRERVLDGVRGILATLSDASALRRVPHGNFERDHPDDTEDIPL